MSQLMASFCRESHWGVGTPAVSSATLHTFFRRFLSDITKINFSRARVMATYSLRSSSLFSSRRVREIIACCSWVRVSAWVS